MSQPSAALEWSTRTLFPHLFLDLYNMSLLSRILDYGIVSYYETSSVAVSFVPQLGILLWHSHASLADRLQRAVLT